MKGGDRWTQGTFEVTGTAKKLVTFSSGEARGSFDLLIQNNDDAGIVYVNLSGDATVSATMFMVRPNGDTLELSNVTNDVSVIGSIASNTIPYSIARNAG